MIRIVLFVIALFVLAVVSGCATGPVQGPDRRAVCTKPSVYRCELMSREGIDRLYDRLPAPRATGR
jgi:hypothetical protein